MLDQIKIVSAPSGGGKTTLNRLLVEKHPNFAISVSLTTRAIRPGEKNGTDYFFVTPPEFQERIALSEMLEWAQVHNNLYGTSARELQIILDQNKTPILEIDVQGFKSIKSKIPSAVAVFILPPSIEVMWQRLRGRGTDAELSRWNRLQNAKKEISAAVAFDHLIINDSIDHAFAELERVLVSNQAPTLPNNDGRQHISKLIKEFDEAVWIADLAQQFSKK